MMATAKTSDRASRDLAGVVPVFQTPYRDDESIDFDALAREIEWLFANGADGVAMAMVSEILRLSTDERKELAAAACNASRGRGFVVISVGAESTRQAVDYAQHAESVGADALMAIPPVTTALDEDQLHRYFSEILRSVKLPLIVQDASGYVGRSMPISLYGRLLDDFGDRVYFKPEATPIGSRLSALREATGGKARVFEGTGGMALVDSFRRGIVGTIPGADLIRGIVALWRALKAGDDARAYRLSLPISALIALQTSLDAFLAIEKYLLVKQGIFTSALVRGPVGFVLDDETRREADRLFELVIREVEAVNQ
jgi:dihydrodipicolinate synthase/N-acetylneuraminate lyase